MARFGSLVSRAFGAVLLTKRHRRRRLQLLQDLRFYSVQVTAGRDASQIWRRRQPSARRDTHLGRGPWRPDSHDPPDVVAWLRCVEELYAAGAPLRETLDAFATQLEDHLERELDAYVEAVPRRAQLVLIAFFAPPAFFVLLYPWLFALGE